MSMIRQRALIIARGGTHQHGWGAAFAEGLKHHGWRVDVQADYDPADLVVLWGVRRQDIIRRAKSDGCEVCILERGYVGDRFKWTSVSFGGGLNNRGRFYGPFEDASRWERHFSHLMRDRHVPEDGYALIMGQVAGDMSVKGANLPQWYQVQAASLQKAGWSVKFRPHPSEGSAARASLGRHVDWVAGDLEAALEGAGLVVTYNSNSGVDAALFGRPVVASDEGSMAWPIAGHRIDDVRTPDRTAWAHALAWKQYSKPEFASGFAWEAITQGACYEELFRS